MGDLWKHLFGGEFGVNADILFHSFSRFFLAPLPTRFYLRVTSFSTILIVIMAGFVVVKKFTDETLCVVQANYLNSYSITWRTCGDFRLTTLKVRTCH